MMTVESITYSVEAGKRKFFIELNSNDEAISIKLNDGRWDKSTVVNALIRVKYSQDQVEAIINNHFLNIADWIDKKFKGEDVAFEDSEYEEFQKWRALSKETSDIVIDAIEELIK
jgi:hypothetical protein